MSDQIYIKKSNISEKMIKDILNKFIDEKDKLEKDAKEDFSGTFILIKYDNQEYYLHKKTFLMFPLIKNYNLEKYAREDKTKEEIVDIFKNIYENEKIDLISEEEYRKIFYNESLSKLRKYEKMKELENFMENALVSSEDGIKCLNSFLEEKDIGYPIPVLRLNIEFLSEISNDKELEKILSFIGKYDIEVLFDKRKQRERLEKLVTLYGDLNRYNSLEKGKNLNYNEIFKDFENGKLEYSIETIKEELLNIDNERINIDSYDEGILYDSQRGHWDIFYETSEINIEDRDIIKVNIMERIYSRDPRRDIKENGVVAIDFGTKSTVVAYQKDNDRSYLAKIGGGSYKEYNETSKYENPTVMEFVNINKFLENYKSSIGRPITKWEDLKISHTAVSNFISGSESVVEGLKQWCGNKKEKFIIYDKMGTKIYLPPYLEMKDDDIDPIELYAYYIGSYINNMCTGDIFLEYLLSFPITYEKEIREKMIKSFEKGLKKSLPLAVLKDKEIMEEFSVIGSTNEPTAYAICALKQFNLIPKNKEEKVHYGVFDFGGGTTDFSFGVCNKSESKRYDYEIKHYGDGGLRYLGGENILRVLSYRVFKENLNKMINENIPIFCPEGCDERFPGYENVILNSYEAKFNMKQICEKLRNLWEKSDEFEYSERIKVSLLRKNGERIDGFELDFDRDELEKIIEEKIEEGIESFIKSLMLTFKGNHFVNDMKKLIIFLAGNSSKNPLVEKIFREKLMELEKRIDSTSKENLFELYLPLGSNDSLEIQNQYGNMLNGKTGTAYGLLETRSGGVVKIIPIDEQKNDSEINFKYFVGYASNGKLKLILDYKTGYNKWVEFLDASERKSDLYYTDKQDVITGNMSTEDTCVKRKKIIIDIIDENASIYIRIKDPETLEYVVGYKDKIENEEYLNDIKELKL